MQNKDFFSGVPIEVREFLLRLLKMGTKKTVGGGMPTVLFIINFIHL